MVWTWFVYRAAEFVLYKPKEIGKINQRVDIFFSWGVWQTWCWPGWDAIDCRPYPVTTRSVTDICYIFCFAAWTVLVPAVNIFVGERSIQLSLKINLLTQSLNSLQEISAEFAHVKLSWIGGDLILGLLLTYSGYEATGKQQSSDGCILKETKWNMQTMPQPQIWHPSATWHLTPTRQWQNTCEIYIKKKILMEQRKKFGSKNDPFIRFQIAPPFFNTWCFERLI
jgi:hypothetical protein